MTSPQRIDALFRAPRVGGRRGEQTHAQAFGRRPCDAASRRGCHLRMRAGRPQLRASGGDRVAAVQGDQGLEDRDAPRESEPKGEWWSVFHDPELDQLMRVVVVSNQTVKADEANYREALALINEVRAGLFPTVNGTGSATRSSPSITTLTAEASGTWTLDVWGQVRREIEAQQAFAETDAANLAIVTLSAAIGACARLCDAQRGRFARGPARKDCCRIQTFADDHPKPV